MSFSPHPTPGWCRALKRPSPTLLLVGGVVAVSTAAILIRSSQAPPLVLAFWRVALGSLLLGGVALLHPRTRKELQTLGRKDLLLLGGVGVILALHFALWITSLSFTSVASSVVLVTIHPLFVGVLSARFLKEPFPPSSLGGVFLAMAGGALIAYSDSQSPGGDSLWGDILALGGAFAAALYFLFGRTLRSRLSLLPYVVPVYSSSSLVLLGLSQMLPPPLGGPLLGYSSKEWTIFLSLGLVPMAVGHTLLNLALRHLPAPYVSSSVLGEPVGSTILALLFLGEIPSPTVVGGGVLVLLGVGWVLSFRPVAPTKG